MKGTALATARVTQFSMERSSDRVDERFVEDDWHLNLCLIESCNRGAPAPDLEGGRVEARRSVILVIEAALADLSDCFAIAKPECARKVERAVLPPALIASARQLRTFGGAHSLSSRSAATVGSLLQRRRRSAPGRPTSSAYLCAYYICRFHYQGNTGAVAASTQRRRGT